MISISKMKSTRRLEDDLFGHLGLVLGGGVTGNSRAVGENQVDRDIAIAASKRILVAKFNGTMKTRWQRLQPV